MVAEAQQSSGYPPYHQDRIALILSHHQDFPLL